MVEPVADCSGTRGRRGSINHATNSHRCRRSCPPVLISCWELSGYRRPFFRIHVRFLGVVVFVMQWPLVLCHRRLLFFSERRGGRLAKSWGVPSFSSPKASPPGVPRRLHANVIHANALSFPFLVLFIRKCLRKPENDRRERTISVDVSRSTDPLSLERWV